MTVANRARVRRHPPDPRSIATASSIEVAAIGVVFISERPAARIVVVLARDHKLDRHAKALCQLVAKIGRDPTRAPACILDDKKGGHFRRERDTETKLARRDEFFHSSLLSLGTTGG